MKEAKVIIDSSERNADLLWATRFSVPDPVVFVDIASRRFLLVSHLEFSRAKKQSRVHEVFSLEKYCERGRKRFGTKEEGSAILALDAFLRERSVDRLVILNSLSYAHGCALKRLGYRLVSTDALFPQRFVKTEKEVREILRVTRLAERAIAKAVTLLRKSAIERGGYLRLGSRRLTAEHLKEEISLFLHKNRCLAVGTIVSCGLHSADPHHEGFGPLRAFRPIIIDIFPRSLESGYYADITRTFCKGSPPARLKNLYDAVLRTQEAVLKKVRPGLSPKKLFLFAVGEFERRKFPFRLVRGLPQGFIHGLGHGLGLELHEGLRLSSHPEVFLRKGNVVTIEPGLYYTHFGGVRIEDAVVVTKNGCRNLASFPKQKFVIP